MPTDISKSSEEQLFDLVVLNNPTSVGNVPFEKIYFTTPSFINIEEGSAAVSIVAIPNSGLTGSVDLTYSKLNLQDFTTIDDNPTVHLSKGSDYLNVVDEFNQLYGSAISEDDVVLPEEFPELTDVGWSFDLVAANESLAYYGGLTVNVKLLSFPIGTFISNTDLGSYSIPIVQRNQTITFVQPDDTPLDESLHVSATSTSKLTVTFSSKTPLVCSVSEDGDVSFVTTGVCTLEANQEGNEYFYPATPVEKSFNVTAVVPGAPTIESLIPDLNSITVAFQPPTYTGGAAITQYKAIASPSGITVMGTSSPLTITGLSPDTNYTITLSAQNSAGYGAVVSDIVKTDKIDSLSSLVANTDMSGYNYKSRIDSSVPAVTVAAQYTYNLDLTPYYSTLQPFAASTVLTQAQADSIVTALSYCDLDGAFRTTWKSNTGTSGTALLWNLEGATVIYNGLNNDSSRPTDPSRKYVMVLQLKGIVTQPLGYVYLTYNQPIDPNNVINPND